MKPHRPLPDRPRLRHGVDAFCCDGELIVRTVAGALQIPRSYQTAVERLLPRLDGHYSYETLLGGHPGAEGLYALGLLSWLSRQGALADGPCARAVVGARTIPRLDGVQLELFNSGPFAKALRAQLSALGATTVFETSASSSRLVLACPDGPALRVLETLNRTLRCPWMAAFPFGDALLISPVFAARKSPCFRCFELRWLGISPSVALEVSYFEHVRVAPPSLVTSENADAVAASVLPLVATRLTGSRSVARVTMIRVDSGELSESPLEPCPHCEVCGESYRIRVTPKPTTQWTDPVIPLEEVGRDLEQAAGIPCGLAVLWERDEQLETVAAPMHVVVSRFTLPEPEKVSGPQENWTHGTAETPEAARAVALIEALERYGGLSSPPRGVWGSFSQLQADALLPTDLPLFSAMEYARQGFPFKAFDPNRETRWNWAFNLTQQRPVLVPTSAAWYGYDDWLLGESSNGVAAHSSRGLALRSAVLELVERDAFMIHWLHRLSPPRISFDAISSDQCGRLIDWIERSGYVVHLLDLTTDLRIPVVLAIGVHEERQRPALLIGAGAALATDHALEKALSELYSATFSAPEQWRLKAPLDQSHIARLGDHASAYEHPDWLPNASFLWSSESCAEWSPNRGGTETTDELSTLTELLRRRGHDLIGVDITGTDVARHRLHIVRAIVPGLQPLALGSRVRLGGTRLFEAPRKMGYADAAQRAEDLNPVPHCFP